MQLRQIVSIKQFKSFIDFNWNTFCKNKVGTIVPLCSFNLFYGENGAGKSSICEILKDLSHHTNFQETPPSFTEIELIDDDGNRAIRKFENGNWNSKQEKNSILFFDKEFVDENVHTNGIRSNEKNRHSQNSGELIIQLDATANDYRFKIKVKNDELADFERSNHSKINQVFTDTEKELYDKHKKITDKAKTSLIEKEKEILDKGNKETKRLETLKLQSDKISSIIAPTEISLERVLSGVDTYQELFSRKLEEAAQEDTSEAFKDHIKKHRSFVESGLEILKLSEGKDVCPFCLQPLSNARDTIKAYSEFFNEAYKRQKQKLIDDISGLKKELEEIRDEVEGLPSKLSTIFDSLEKLDTDYAISNLYDPKKKEEITKSFEVLKQSHSQFFGLLEKIENLKKIDNTSVDFLDDYNAILFFIKTATTKLESLNKLINAASIKINEFKKKYSDPNTIQKEMEVEALGIKEATALIDFFEKGAFSKIKEWSELHQKKEAIKDELSTLKAERDKYLTEKAPEIVLNKMTETLERFNLSFKLQSNPISRPTSGFPFSFKVVDETGKVRDIKNGLSEGERQLISIAFFFALNEKTQDKDKKVVVFDDPITSLDSANLKILADLIHEQIQQRVFAQVIILTHHPLFHKYLTKKQNPNVNKFGILKNHSSFGGSFIYYDPGFDTIECLRNCHLDIQTRAQGGGLNVEDAALQYGHLLRISVERFIKNDLLLWSTNNFDSVVDGLKEGQSKIKKLELKDIETIEEIYQYCNHSNLLHADKEAASALTELINHIEHFVTTIDKINA